MSICLCLRSIARGFKFIDMKVLKVESGMAPPRVPLALHRWSRLRRPLEVFRDIEFVRRGEEACVLLLENLLLLSL